MVRLLWLEALFSSLMVNLWAVYQGLIVMVLSILPLILLVIVISVLILVRLVVDLMFQGLVVHLLLMLFLLETKFWRLVTLLNLMVDGYQKLLCLIMMEVWTHHSFQIWGTG